MPHVLSILDHSGDIRHFWDPAKPDEVAHAQRTFDEFVGKGYLAYRLTGGGGRGEQIRAFDPQSAEILLSPPLRGG